MMKKTVFAVLTTSAFVLSMGVEPLSAALQEGQSMQGSQGTSSQQQERQVATKLKDTHAYKEYLKGEDIRVEEKNGVMTLKGTVSDDSKKALAEETALALPGVEKVENHLEVKNGRSGSDGMVSDAWLAAKVKAALTFQRGVSGTDTDVDVKNGVVTLRGQAESDAQKKLATEVVQEIEGVREVRNELQMYGPIMGKTGPKDGTTDNLIGSGYPAVGTGSISDQEAQIDDASVTASVKSALRMGRSGSLPSEIKTENGVVTLKGEAASAEEKNRISNRVSNIRGVKSVRNEMIIASSGSGASRPDRTLTGQEGVSPVPAGPTGSAPQDGAQQK